MGMQTGITVSFLFLFFTFVGHWQWQPAWPGRATVGV